MKKILILSVFASLIFAGCSPDNSVNTIPQNNSDQKLEWLCANADVLKSETELTITKSINGNVGGSILFNDLIGKINITGSLKILPGSFPGNQVISVTLNDTWLYQTYYPSPYIFRIPLVLNLIYKNVNLVNEDVSAISFYYLSDDGQFIQAEYDSCIIDQLNGTLEIIGAKLPHFSRWGWAKSIQ